MTYTKHISYPYVMDVESLVECKWQTGGKFYHCMRLKGHTHSVRENVAGYTVSSMKGYHSWTVDLYRGLDIAIFEKLRNHQTVRILFGRMMYAVLDSDDDEVPADVLKVVTGKNV